MGKISTKNTTEISNLLEKIFLMDNSSAFPSTALEGILDKWRVGLVETELSKDIIEQLRS